MFPTKALLLMALPGLIVLGAEAGDPPKDEDRAEVRLVADTSSYNRREARSRLGRQALPEHDQKATGRVGGKLVRLPSDYRQNRNYEPRSYLGERRAPRAEQPYERRYERRHDGYERRREERAPLARERLNIEARSKVSRGPA